MKIKFIFFCICIIVIKSCKTYKDISYTDDEVISYDDYCNDFIYSFLEQNLQMNHTGDKYFYLGNKNFYRRFFILNQSCFIGENINDFIGRFGKESEIRTTISTKYIYNVGINDESIDSFVSFTIDKDSTIIEIDWLERYID